MSNLVLTLPMLLVITVRDDTPDFLPLCRCTTFVALFTAITSTCVLVVIAANRFRKLCQPQRSQVSFLPGVFCCFPFFLFSVCVCVCDCVCVCVCVCVCAVSYTHLTLPTMTDV